MRPMSKKKKTLDLSAPYYFLSTEMLYGTVVLLMLLEFEPFFLAARHRHVTEVSRVCSRFKDRIGRWRFA